MYDRYTVPPSLRGVSTVPPSLRGVSDDDLLAPHEKQEAEKGHPETRRQPRLDHRSTYSKPPPRQRAELSKRRGLQSRGHREQAEKRGAHKRKTRSQLSLTFVLCCAGRNHTWTTAFTVPIQVRVA
jgi:hypothetical protein